ncbi:MAG TPA: hypothetical protein VFA68_21170 [Terriglobales bacterium]|nr:hypothetical protein [Terriglobales bacterium]
MLPELLLDFGHGAGVSWKLPGRLSASASDPLTAFDRALVRLVAQGLPDRVIAQRLALEEDQFRDALINIFRKLALAGLLDQLLYTNNETDQIAC